MKQYKIDAFKGYEKFMKKIGRKEGYICYIGWVDKNRMNIKLTYPGFIAAHTTKENATVDANYGEHTLYADNRIVDVLRIPDITLDMSFKVVGDDKDGILAVTKGE